MYLNHWKLRDNLMGDNIQSIMVWGYTQIDFTLQLWAIFGRPLIQENCGAQEVNYWEVMIIKVQIGIKFLARFIIAFFFCFIYWIKNTHGKFITNIKVTNCYLLNFYVGNTASHLSWQGQDFVSDWCSYCSHNLAKFKSQWRYNN